jgi:hypothetical protein
LAPRNVKNRAVIQRLAAVAVISLWPMAALAVDLLQEMLRAADRGQCIETQTFVVIQTHGPGLATAVVQAALQAQALRRDQQRSLGCAGDIAAQAIAAGADPSQVLRATAAGL